jgi:uncharacterized RDD family membrane protein YckC
VASVTLATRSGRDEFTVHGMTGVDLSLVIAGPGSRSFAFLIDWHIRLVIALAWLFGGMLITGGSLRLPSSSVPWIVALVVGPAALIYFLYHPVVELLMRGQTPGKRMAGVRIVNRDGGPPGAGAILIRNAFRLVDSMPAFYLVGLACTFVTDQRIRIGDMAAGTLLVETNAHIAGAMDRVASRTNARGLEPAALDLVDQLLERWDGMEADRRGAIARLLLQQIQPNPPLSPAELPDAALHARLVALSGSGDAQQ